MPLAIEDYALISDCHTGALVGRDGSIDWLCFPDYDSASTFGALLGDEDHGRWLVAPDAEGATSTRRYRTNTFVLVTTWSTPSGEVEVTDLMPIGGRRADVVRRVRGVSGRVTMRQELRFRFGYATALPWVRQVRHEGDGGHALVAAAGPDAVVVRGPRLTAADHAHRNTFDVSAGETVDLTLTWFPSHRPPPEHRDVDDDLARTVSWWRDWARNCQPPARYSAEVTRSLLVLRALTHADTGGIAAAVTTSLPEQAGGGRNWDYRYVWLRDASLTLEALMTFGFTTEAQQWRRWLLRAIAGDPADIQIMYGLAGQRYLPERELDSLPGYEGASPVRVGNEAFLQYQGDVFGEVMIALHRARTLGVVEDEFSWPLQRALMSHVERNWQRADQGIWEIRGPERHFVHSRAMLWAAFEYACRGITEHGLPGPLKRWQSHRDRIREEIETRGFDRERNTFVQYYGSTEVDASLLQLPQIGFIDADDPRMLGTTAAIERDLMRDGLLMRYRAEAGVDGLEGDENPFLACSFWLVEQYARTGRRDEAIALMDRLTGFASDVGLLSEEYDVHRGRQMGNYPQAFSHLALVQAAAVIGGDDLGKPPGED